MKYAAGGLCVALAVLPAASRPGLRNLLLLVGLVGLGLVVVSLRTRIEVLGSAGLVVLLLEYGLSLLGRSGIDPSAPAYAAVLLAAVEGISLSQEAEPHSWERGRRLAGMAILGGAGSTVILGVTAMTGVGGPVVHAGAVGAVGAVIGLLTVLVRRQVARPAPARSPHPHRAPRRVG